MGGRAPRDPGSLLEMDAWPCLLLRCCLACPPVLVIAPGTNAVRCACGTGLLSATNTIERSGVPEGLRLDACVAPGGLGPIDCAPEPCPANLPGDPERMRTLMLRCTQVVEDSRWIQTRAAPSG